MLVEIEVGGGGGHPEQDGPNAYACGMHNNSNIPVEMIESELPLTITRYELLPDTGGAGRRPGRPRPRARMARGLPGGGVHGQSRAVQVPPLRPRRRRAGHAGAASS